MIIMVFLPYSKLRWCCVALLMFWMSDGPQLWLWISLQFIILKPFHWLSLDHWSRTRNGTPITYFFHFVSVTFWMKVEADLLMSFAHPSLRFHLSEIKMKIVVMMIDCSVEPKVVPQIIQNCLDRLTFEFPPTGGVIAARSFQVVKLLRYLTAGRVTTALFSPIFNLQAS